MAFGFSIGLVLGHCGWQLGGQECRVGLVSDYWQGVLHWDHLES
jgi:hypothetical protein